MMAEKPKLSPEAAAIEQALLLMQKSGVSLSVKQVSSLVNTVLSSTPKKKTKLDKWFDKTRKSLLIEIKNISSDDTTDLEITIAEKQQKYLERLIQKKGLDKQSAEDLVEEKFLIIEKALEKKKVSVTDKLEKQKKKDTEKNVALNSAREEIKKNFLDKIDALTASEIGKFENALSNQENALELILREFFESDTVLQTTIDKILAGVRTELDKKKEALKKEEQQKLATEGQKTLKSLDDKSKKLIPIIENMTFSDIGKTESEINDFEERIKNEMEGFVETDQQMIQVIQNLLGNIKTAFGAKKTELEKTEKVKAEEQTEMAEVIKNYQNSFNLLSKEDQDLLREHYPHPYMPPRS